MMISEPYTTGIILGSIFGFALGYVFHPEGDCEMAENDDIKYLLIGGAIGIASTWIMGLFLADDSLVD